MDDIGTVIVTSVACSAAVYISYNCYNLYNQYKTLLNAIEEKIENTQHSVVIHDQYIEISYYYMTTPYTVRIPFNHFQIVPQTQTVVYAKKDGVEVDITQQPGIPYILSPSEMKVDEIIIFNLNDETENTYIDDEIPMYG